MNYLTLISYKGTRYAGFQSSQMFLRSARVLQDAMAVFGCRPRRRGLLRTDAGVHAAFRAQLLLYWQSADAENRACAQRPPAAGYPRSGHPVRAGRLHRAAHAKTYRYYILNARGWMIRSPTTPATG